MPVKTLLVLALAVVAAGPTDDAKKDLQKLQGHWIMASAVHDGADLPSDLMSKLKFDIKGDHFTLKGDEETIKTYSKIKLKLDASAKPHLIDFIVGAGEDKGTDIEGIYEWQSANEFKVCVKLDGKQRPTEFKSPENSNTALIVFQREGD